MYFATMKDKKTNIKRKCRINDQKILRRFDVMTIGEIEKLIFLVEEDNVVKTQRPNISDFTWYISSNWT